MKYKILLTGGNRTVIDEFFLNMDSVFDCFTTSLRYEDIRNHAKYVKPDALVYCLNNETRENISQMVAIKQKSHGELPIIIVGDADECDEFIRIAINTADLVLKRPLTVTAIQDGLFSFLEHRRIKLEETMERLRLEAEANKRKHILVVDDDIRMLKSIKEQLHDTYDVATALSGKLALKFLESKDIDLILLDYEMPDENGPAVLTKIRENSKLADIPVLFLTGVTEREKIQNALSLRPQGYLLKPIDHQKLIETIKEFI